MPDRYRVTKVLSDCSEHFHGTAPTQEGALKLILAAMHEEGVQRAYQTDLRPDEDLARIKPVTAAERENMAAITPVMPGGR